MTLYLKVPPEKGPTVCIFAFENAKFKGTSTFEYTKLTLYTDVKYQPYTSLKLNREKLNKVRSLVVNKKIDIVVCNRGYHKNEILYENIFGKTDSTIPLLDRMICMFYKKESSRLEYTEVSRPHNEDKDILLSLLGNEKLTKQEKKLLGL